MIPRHIFYRYTLIALMSTTALHASGKDEETDFFSASASAAAAAISTAEEDTDFFDASASAAAAAEALSAKAFSIETLPMDNWWYLLENFLSIRDIISLAQTGNAVREKANSCLARYCRLIESQFGCKLPVQTGPGITDPYTESPTIQVKRFIYHTTNILKASPHPGFTGMVLSKSAFRFITECLDNPMQYDVGGMHHSLSPEKDDLLSSILSGNLMDFLQSVKHEREPKTTFDDAMYEAYRKHLYKQDYNMSLSEYGILGVTGVIKTQEQIDAQQKHLVPLGSIVNWRDFPGSYLFKLSKALDSSTSSPYDLYDKTPQSLQILEWAADKGDPSALFTLGQCHFNRHPSREDLEDSASSASAAAAAAGDKDSNVDKFTDEKYAKAESYFKRMKILPPLALQSLGRIYMHRENFGEAVQYLSRALVSPDYNPKSDDDLVDNVLTLECLSECYVNMKDYKKAIPINKRILSEVYVSGKPMAQFKLGNLYILDGQPDQGEAELLAVFDILEDDIDRKKDQKRAHLFTLYLLGSHYIETDQKEKHEAILYKMLQRQYHTITSQNIFDEIKDTEFMEQAQAMILKVSEAGKSANDILTGVFSILISYQ